MSTDTPIPPGMPEERPLTIVQILPGSGGTFYCQNCLRDNVLASELRAMGHDTILVPMYLPPMQEFATAAGAPVFFGGINVYLQERSSFFRNTPRWLDRLFDAQWLLRLAARGEGRTRAADLADMTLSMLAGRDGRQAKELERLVGWLHGIGRPDVIHLSSALLLGLAPAIREAMDCPLICSVQDEDTWLDAMPAAPARQAWQRMAALSADVSVLLAPSVAFAGRMAEKLELPPERFRVVPLGIPLDGYAPAPGPVSPPTIGYLSRLNESLGLDLLTDAFLRLRRRPNLGALRLRATGGIVGRDRAFLRRLRRTLARAGASDSVEFIEDFSRDRRIEFLRSLSVLSVPTPAGEAFGLFILEALACGVPVVQPRAGGYPEVVRDTGGGALCEPGDAASLADALEPFVADPNHARAIGLRGRTAVLARYGSRHMAENMVREYRRAIANKLPRGVSFSL